MKMLRTILIVTFLFVAGVVVFITYACEDDWCFIFPWQEKKNYSSDNLPQKFSSAQVFVGRPSIGALVTSPLAVEGEARGTWYFEASFPVRLLDGNGIEIGRVPAQAQGDWMTTEFVPFRAEIQFVMPSTPTGTLVLEKDNPSGLPEHADEVRFPVRFK